MSREIKFRCWSEKEKAYLDGPGRFLWVSHDDTTSGLYSPTDLQITLEQYTGLKDKNGKEIYEGDIVKLYDNNYIVKWNESNFAFTFSNERQFYWLSPSKKEDCQVIGNIHENKELLGDKK